MAAARLDVDRSRVRHFRYTHLRPPPTRETPETRPFRPVPADELISGDPIRAVATSLKRARKEWLNVLHVHSYSTYSLSLPPFLERSTDVLSLSARPLTTITPLAV